jgi:hypothetical protein
MKLAVDEAAIVPAVAGPYTITVAHAGDLQRRRRRDLHGHAGAPQVRRRRPAVGQYSVNPATGVYTFAAADTLKGVTISYIYNDAANGRPSP